MFDMEYMEGQWVAFSREWLGCYAAGPAQATCRAAISAALAGYDAWLRAHRIDPRDPPAPDAAEIGEVHHEWSWGDPPYEVNAFFAADRPALSGEEIARGLRLLAASRSDLMAALNGLSHDEVEREVEDGWSIARILTHVANSEHWYLRRIDAGPQTAGLPDDPLERLGAVRQHTETVLPTLAGDGRLAAVSYEIWSPRKVLRRAVWHERDHAAHIRQFRERIGA